MIEFEKLTPGRAVDVKITARTGRPSVEARVNHALGKVCWWRLGRVDGVRSLLEIVPPYRSVRLWFR